MSQFATDYRHLDDDELLQLWVERFQLVDEARAALREEISRRGIKKEAEVAVDRRAEPSQPVLAPPVETFMGVSALWWLLRELWLRNQTQGGVYVDAIVGSTKRTRHGYRSAARAELCYAYEYQGTRHVGRAVRDFVLNTKAADALAFNHTQGERIPVKINPLHPERSYYPSGFGWIESVVLGVFGFGVWLFVAGVVLGPLLGRYFGSR
jgi:hypothetical protein